MMILSTPFLEIESIPIIDLVELYSRGSFYYECEIGP